METWRKTSEEKKVLLREEWLGVHLHEGKGLGKSGLKRGMVLYMKGKVWGKVVLREVVFIGSFT